MLPISISISTLTATWLVHRCSSRLEALEGQIRRVYFGWSSSTNPKHRSPYAQASHRCLFTNDRSFLLRRLEFEHHPNLLQFQLQLFSFEFIFKPSSAPSRPPAATPSLSMAQPTSNSSPITLQNSP
ncbi:hypothetical protein GALMADRAFT_240726 [Galerina marginata CBS 339.88]|uniref:Uncharacterized protein n=1 Tax=Galerina marginata (strain CBS 339.88) TaxID=685588 RepID=A0A067TIL8_GALM3|nr:hypothetical protein GALMADRAFT_240726 [Galerina marginata CBS 339.88]